MPGLDDVTPWTEFDFGDLRGRPLYCYVGAGLSMAAGLIGWDEMVKMIDRFRAEYEGGRSTAPKRKTARANSRYLQRFIEQTGSGAVPILSHGSTDERVFGRTVLLNLLLRFREPESGPARTAMEVTAADFPDLSLHSLIWQTRCQGVLTTNYDMLLEEAFLQHPLDYRKWVFGHMGPLRSYRYTAEFVRFLMSNPRFVLKLHGDVNDLGTMVFDPYSAWNAGGVLGGPLGADLREAYIATLSLGHVIYVGSGLRDRTFKELHRAWRARGTAVDHLRIALIPSRETKTMRDELGKAGVRSVTDITFLTYGGGSAQQGRRVLPAEEVRAFLQAIVETVQEDQSRFGRRARCPEGRDIWGQVMRRSGERMKKYWTTTEWTVEGRPLGREA